MECCCCQELGEQLNIMNLMLFAPGISPNTSINMGTGKPLGTHHRTTIPGKTFCHLFGDYVGLL
jgi:hypothetical protein